MLTAVPLVAVAWLVVLWLRQTAGLGHGVQIVGPWLFTLQPLALHLGIKVINALMTLQGMLCKRWMSSHVCVWKKLLNLDVGRGCPVPD